jgi:hypothetical protein
MWFRELRQRPPAKLQAAHLPRYKRLQVCSVAHKPLIVSMYRLTLLGLRRRPKARARTRKRRKKTKTKTVMVAAAKKTGSDFSSPSVSRNRDTILRSLVSLFSLFLATIHEIVRSWPVMEAFCVFFHLSK